MEHNYLHETYDCITGETTIVPFTEEEVAAYEAAKAENEARIQAEADAKAERLAVEAQKAAEEAARLSAKLAIYAKLGLTEEEINTLIS
jgi:hypothetical protein